MLKFKNSISAFLGFIIICWICPLNNSFGQSPGKKLNFVNISEIRCGAERTDLYFQGLSGKSIGVVCNQTSVVGNCHLVDTLTRAGVKIIAIFSPEHGFRGESEAGADIKDGTDTRTGIKIISIYGKKKKPSPEDLEGIEVLLFDIQDVGVRFYTYISTLALVMEAASEKGIPVIVLDRPNPNGFYIDGPVLDTNFKSFVGMHPVPVVYGMTIGEYAAMINGEGWVKGNRCDLTIIPLEGYHHRMIVELNVKPSPNLPNWQSVYLYPSLCLFEGTIVTVGRGTDSPFQVIGHPDYLIGSMSFTPGKIPGVVEHPPFEGQACHGLDLSWFAEDYSRNSYHFSLAWLLIFYSYFKDTGTFFTQYFDKLAGNDQLRNDIINGISEPEIRRSWEDDLARFRQTRSKYLIYPD